MKNNIFAIILCFFIIAVYPNVLSAKTDKTIAIRKEMQQMAYSFDKLDKNDKKGRAILIHQMDSLNNLMISESLREAWVNFDTINANGRDYRRLGMKTLASRGNKNLSNICFSKGSELGDAFCINKMFVYLVKKQQSPEEALLYYLPKIATQDYIFPLIHNIALSLGVLEGYPEIKQFFKPMAKWYFLYADNPDISFTYPNVDYLEYTDDPTLIYFGKAWTHPSNYKMRGATLRKIFEESKKR